MAVSIRQISPATHLPLVLGVLRKLDVAIIINPMCPLRY
jgi:hypothetical protein